MGLLTDPAATKKVAEKINKYGTKFGWLGLISGLVWLVLQSSSIFNSNTYVDENALIPGIARPQATKSNARLADAVNDELGNCQRGPNYIDCQFNIIEMYAKVLRAKFERNSWTTCNKFNECTVGTNLIVQLRAKWSNPIESIVVNVPLNGGYKPFDGVDDIMERVDQNRGVGIALSMMEMIKYQQHWGKEFVFVFSEFGRKGIQCWLEANFMLPLYCGELTWPEIIAHSPQTGVVLDVGSSSFREVNVNMEGDLAQMTNQDIVNVAVRVANRFGIPVTMSNLFGPEKKDDFSHLFFKQLLQIGSGEGTGNHANLMKFGIHAITLQTSSNHTGRFGTLAFMRLTEGLLRSENNLLERLHASIWFYIFSSTDHYSSISLYMPVIGLVLLLPLLNALKTWVMAQDISVDQFCDGVKPILKVTTFTMITNVIGGHLIIWMPEYVTYVMSFCLLFPTVIGPFMLHYQVHEKVESLVFLTFVLQCGLLSLLCFPQALYLAVTSIFVILAKKKLFFIYLAHPIIFFAVHWIHCEYAKYLVSVGEAVDQIGPVLDWNSYFRELFLSDHGNLYNLIMYSALPIWSALYVTALSRKKYRISKQKVD